MNQATFPSQQKYTYFLKHSWISLPLKNRKGSAEVQLRVGSWIPGIFFIPSGATWDCGSDPACVPAKELTVASDAHSTALQILRKA